MWARINVPIPKRNPNNKNTTIKETAVTTSALINGMLAMLTHAFWVIALVLDNPMAAATPINREIAVETTATNSEVKIDFKNGWLCTSSVYHFPEKEMNEKTVSPELKENTIMTAIGT
jgi:hypothetical protein